MSNKPEEGDAFDQFIRDALNGAPPAASSPEPSIYKNLGKLKTEVTESQDAVRIDQMELVGIDLSNPEVRTQFLNDINEEMGNLAAALGLTLSGLELLDSTLDRLQPSMTDAERDTLGTVHGMVNEAIELMKQLKMVRISVTNVSTMDAKQILDRIKEELEGDGDGK